MASAPHDCTFEAIIFDWDGTAVRDRQADASGVRAQVEALCAAGVHVFVVSGTHVGNVDGQLSARPVGPGRLHLCLNRGSEVFAVDAAGVRTVARRRASPAEEAALDRAADAAVAALADRGLECRIVSQRLNRRKIDIIPEPEWADPPKARIDELLVAVTKRLLTAGFDDLADVVALASSAAHGAGLERPCVTSDVKHVEIGLTDKSDSARWAADWLGQRGITGSLVLVAGDEFGPVGGATGSDAMMLVPELARASAVSVGVEPGGVPVGVRHLGGGPDRFAALLDAQLARRRARRVPWIDEDPAWVVQLPDEPAMERAAEAIGALGNGRAALRAAREEDGPATVPLFVVNGVYEGTGADQHLLEGPVWTQLAVRSGRPDRRLLDLRTGMLARASTSADGLTSIRFLSAARPTAMALRAESADAHLAEAPPFAELAGAQVLSHDDRAGIAVARTGDPAGAGIVVATRDRVEAGDLHVVERLAAWSADPLRPPDAAVATGQLDELDAVGFDALAAEHRAAWARRWSDATVTIDGDPASQLAARYALYHVLAAAPDEGEAAVGARGMTGPAYGGHVFWDADVFALPVLAAVRPAAARAMLEYRIRRLPAARARAAEQGADGARFPWESARDGDDVTPVAGQDAHGRTVEILTGALEQHVVADVAWAACKYAEWTGDSELLTGPGGALVTDAARYWASRIELDAAGAGHLRGVIGPDEYHERVDDNAYTNVMARWNLRRAAQLVEGDGGAEDAARWRRLADSLVDGWDPRAGCTSSSPATGISSPSRLRPSPHRRWPPTCCSAPIGCRARSSSSRPTW